MTIKELEQKTGMARANIRFYEEEGLLCPRRLENGYRDYSDEDARTLEKIRLLRSLRLDIGTIRSVQRGALPLAQALSAQLPRMTRDAAALRRAVEVCEAIGQSGVAYDALEPKPWLRRLEPEQPSRHVRAAPVLAAQDVRAQALCACDHPWQRFFARALDTALCGTLLRALWTAGLRGLGLFPAAARSALGLWGWGLAALLCALAVEPFLLRFWGWTPGKYLFGLCLRRADGNRLTLGQARARCRRVAWEGCGLLLPAWRLWTLGRAFRAGRDGRDSPWDSEEGFRYTKRTRRAAAPCCAAALLLCFAAQELCALLAQTPPRTGPLTVEAFSHNYGYYWQSLCAGDERPALPALDAGGRWIVEEPAGTVVVSEETFNGVPVTGGVTWSEPRFTLRDGKITAVTLHWESDRTVLFPGGTRETLALLALSGSAEEATDPLLYDLRGWLELAEGFARWDSWEARRGGLGIVQQTEREGYRDEGAYLLALPGETPRFARTVTISLSGE